MNNRQFNKYFLECIGYYEVKNRQDKASMRETYAALLDAKIRDGEIKEKIGAKFTYPEWMD